MGKILPIVGLATALTTIPLLSKGQTTEKDNIKQKNQTELVDNFKNNEKGLNIKNISHKEIINIPADSLSIDTLRKHMLIEINNIRDSLEIGNQLKINKKINECAQKYAEYMYKNNRFDHEDKEGKNHTDRLKNYGFYWKNITGSTENLGKNQETIHEILNSRLNGPSLPHRETLLGEWDDDIGIGYYKGFWVINIISLRN